MCYPFSLGLYSLFAVFLHILSCSYLVKLVNSKKNTFSETDENYLNFVNNQNTNTRKTILQSYDQLLNSKYQVQLNQKTIDRVKNYFK